MATKPLAATSLLLLTFAMHPCNDAAADLVVSAVTSSGSLQVSGVGILESSSVFSGLPLLDHDFDPVTGDLFVLRNQGPATVTRYSAISGYTASSLTFPAAGGKNSTDNLAAYGGTFAYTTSNGSVNIDGVGTIEHFSDFPGLGVLDYDFDPTTGDFYVLRNEGLAKLTKYTRSSNYAESSFEIVGVGETEQGTNLAVYDGKYAFESRNGNIRIGGPGISEIVEDGDDFTGFPVLDFDFDPATGDLFILRDQAVGLITKYTAESGYTDSSILPNLLLSTGEFDNLAVHNISAVPEVSPALIGFCVSSWMCCQYRMRSR